VTSPQTISQRLALTGMGGLAVLTGTQWLREQVRDPAPAVGFALGVMPNLAAAFAMPLVLASFFPGIARVPITGRSRHSFTRLLGFTLLGLGAWEFIQTRSEQFVFDLNDLVATVLGSLFAYGAFAWHARGVRLDDDAGRYHGEPLP
jgi:thiol:disulfide interchange protein